MSNVNQGVQRIRSRSHEPAYAEKQTWNNDTQYNAAEVLVSTYDDTMMDYVTKGYDRRISRGELITNDCTKSVSYLSIERPGHYDYSKNGDRWWTKGPVAEWRRTAVSGIGFFSDHPILDATPQIKLAKQRALGAIDRTPYSFGEDVAEIRESLKYLRNVGLSFGSLGKNLRKKVFKASRIDNEIARNSALSEIYLAWRFAASPLIKSSMDAIEAYNGGSRDRQSRRLSARGYASTSTVESGLKVVGVDGWMQNSRRTLSVRANILYTHSGGSGTGFLLGLRPKDIPLTAWNVVPLSFMVDRAYDISSAIRGVSNIADPRTKILTASYSTKTESTSTMEWKSHYPGQGFTGSVSGSSSWFESAYNRRSWSPSIVDAAPVFTPGNLMEDAKSTADLFALGIQAVTSVFKPFKLIFPDNKYVNWQ